MFLALHLVEISVQPMGLPDCLWSTFMTRAVDIWLPVLVVALSNDALSALQATQGNATNDHGRGSSARRLPSCSIAAAQISNTFIFED